MGDDHLIRAQLVHLEVQRLAREARGTDDAERLAAICRELEVLHDSMLEIRREQLTEQLSKPKRRWWRRGHVAHGHVGIRPPGGE